MQTQLGVYLENEEYYSYEFKIKTGFNLPSYFIQ